MNLDCSLFAQGFALQIECSSLLVEARFMSISLIVARNAPGSANFSRNFRHEVAKTLKHHTSATVRVEQNGLWQAL
jgi:hypothetical protein